MSVEGLNAGADAVKQIVTLSAGLVGLTVTFADKFGDDVAGKIVIPTPLYVAWAGYGISIFFGVWCLLAISGSLDMFVGKEGKEAELTIYRSNVRVPMLVMLLAFLLGIVATVIANLRISWC
ncbi:MAG TPA: hypothetical protein DC046_01490 [Rhodospirillaceae bacterium]|nr:hypothetical protein [Rhodospirillaceae bacterium]|tara:strand:- start:211 stop:576 length:366 start_codon:yes stop_codon:yes gene_type:complete